MLDSKIYLLVVGGACTKGFGVTESINQRPFLLFKRFCRDDHRKLCKIPLVSPVARPGTRNRFTLLFDRVQLKTF